jgi:hypothetical protein
MATVSEPLALMAAGTSASTAGTAPGVPVADDELPVGDAGGVVLVVLELLEHPAATRVVTTAASVIAAAFPGRRRAASTVCLARTLLT